MNRIAFARHSAAWLTLSLASLASLSSAIADDNHELCRPEGLYQTAGVAVPYCTVYDQQGREKMGADHPRRVIGYFTSWRTGKNGQTAYLANNIPWQHLTHINYAFAHIDSQHRVSIGDVNDANNPATGLTWPSVTGAEMDPAFQYHGHFNLLNKYKKRYPQVKTLISIGGWAETGGYFNEAGERVASGGFYSMTTNADNSVNLAGINTFADSVVDFLRRYQFDGADIDYEYPTSMNDAGHPDDFPLSNARRAGLVASYQVLIKTLREKLDRASAQDGKHYLLTIASPSSGYLLRGMEAFPVTDYLDYVNIMSYDLHGAWNQFVGPNAALYDNGKDNELAVWSYYTTSQYQQIGYLNTDWAYHYFRGALPAGRVNIGVPYYTRGWRNVQGGTNGLWGTASYPDQNRCPSGTGKGDKNDCGNGAIGIDNLWHDKDNNGNELGAGSNPMWHAKNLEHGISGSYLADYGLNPANPDHQLLGNYQRFYDNSLVAPWLWNSQKKVFLSTEDEQSIATKAQYVVDHGIGGIMFWELAGDYQFDNSSQQYQPGDTLTALIAQTFKTAAGYGTTRQSAPLPATALAIQFSLSGFKLGEQNYPINPVLTLTNQGNQTIAGGAEFSFNVPTAIPDNITDQSGAGLKVIHSGRNSNGNNLGGLQQDFHRVQFTLKSYQSLAPGASLDIKLNYYLPMPTPSGWQVKIGQQIFALAQEYPKLPLGEITGGTGDTGGGSSCTGVPSQVNDYPNFPQTDWAGKPSHANAGDYLRHNGKIYRANWWTSSIPGSDGSWQLVCDSGNTTPNPDPTPEPTPDPTPTPEPTPDPSPEPTGNCTSEQATAPEYPNFPQLGWDGKPSHANGGDLMQYQNKVYRAQWWTNSQPGSDGSWQSVCQR